ncbi:GNAT family N-acetyltransferase [Leuconostoc koreense]|nr:GNAT family N-acetyltransferase [Leuconostoc mesenteroides]QGM24894.1 GNAT family N-acetyltransferase [Leuconostoc mesenteroides subsp. mesenteroides]
MIKIVDVTEENKAYWQNIYMQSFPAYERLDFIQLAQMAKTKESIKMALIVDEQPVGILLLVEISVQKVFVLYFAVDTNIRGRGIGSQTIDALKNQYPNGVILESEITGQQADNEVQRVKRYDFYKRNGVNDSHLVTKNMGGTFHLLRTTDDISEADYLNAVSELGIEAQVEEF